MLQVGRLGCSSRTSGCPVPANLVAWTRAHFSAFAIVSSPLVLSINPTDENLESILDIIGNKLARKVNQAWVGHPGTLVKEYPPKLLHLGSELLPPGTTCHAGEMQGGDVHVANLTIADGVEWCQTHAHCGGFTAKETCNSTATASTATEVLELHFKDPWGTGHSNTDPSWAGWRVGGCRPVAGVQLWAKPISKSEVAALFINGGTSSYSAELTLKELNISSASATVLDVWTGESAGASANGVWSTGTVASLDSRFVIFTSVGSK